MTNMLRSMMRKLATMPIIGSVVRMIVAFRRLPWIMEGHVEWRHQQAIEAERRSVQSDVDSRLQKLENFDLPSQWLALDKRLTELEKSLPVSLRNMSRDIQSLKSSGKQLSNQADLADASGIEDLGAEISASVIDDVGLSEGEATALFCPYVMERLPLEQLTSKYLPYWFSLLKSGGQFRAVVADVNGVTCKYGEGVLAWKEMNEAPFAPEFSIDGRRCNFFNAISLTEVILAAGFVDVRIDKTDYDFHLVARRP
jgi:hypothetical protein